MTWSVIQTESQRELVAEDYLKRGGFETYLPRIRIQNHGRMRNVALFPGYLFVQLGDRWYRARWSVGVIRVLMIDIEQPARVPDEFIDGIRKREGPDGFVKLPKAPSNQLRKGQRIRVIRGGFEGLFGLYDHMSGRERETILLELLGRSVAVSLPSRDIVAAAS